MNLAAARAAPGVIAIVTAAERRQARQGELQHGVAARRPAGRALSPSDRTRRCRFLRAGARGRATRARRVRACEGQLRPRRREGVRQARRQFRHAGRDEGRRLRRCLQVGPRAARRELHDGARVARDDGAARDASPRGRATELTIWTANQMIDWTAGDLAKTLGIAEGKGACRIALHRRWLRREALAACGCAARSARRASGRPSRESRAGAGAGRQQHRSPLGDAAANPHRRNEGRQDHGHRARELVGRPAQGQARGRGGADAIPLRGSGSHDLESARGAGPSRSKRDARAQRGARPRGAGNRDGRDGREARHGSGRVSHRQRHAGRPGLAGQAGVGRPAVEGAGGTAQSPSSVLAAATRRVPATGRAALRLGQAQREAGPGSRRSLARRHGHGRGVPRQPHDEVGRARAPRPSAASSRSRPT